jgi:HSP20 family protein
MAEQNKGSEKQENKTALSERGERGTGLAHYGGSWIASPFSFMRRFSEEMDRLFEDFGVGGSPLSLSTGGQISPREFGRGLWHPPIELFIEGDDLVVRAELPGMSKEDVKVECTDDEVTIQGERKMEKKEEHEGHYHTERRYGRFYRKINLPEGTKAENAKASFRDGILEIKLKAPQQAQSREIPIG